MHGILRPVAAGAHLLVWTVGGVPEVDVVFLVAAHPYVGISKRLNSSHLTARDASSVYVRGCNMSTL